MIVGGNYILGGPFHMTFDAFMNTIPVIFS